MSRFICTFVHTPETFYTRNLVLVQHQILHKKPFEPEAFYTSSVLHQKISAPPFFTPEAFTAEAFNTTYLCTTRLYTRTFYCRKLFAPERFYTTQLLRPISSTPAFYTRSLCRGLSNQNPTTRLFHQKPFAPHFVQKPQHFVLGYLSKTCIQSHYYTLYCFRSL